MELHDPSEHQNVVVNVISLHCLSVTPEVMNW